MAMNIDIDRSDLLRVKATMAAIGKSANPVMARAINKTVTNSQTFAVQEIYNVLNLTKTRIRKDFKKTRAYASKVSASLIAKGKKIGIIQYGARTLKSGLVRVRIFRNQGLETFRHVFFAIMPSGHEGYFERRHWFGGPAKMSIEQYRMFMWKFPRNIRLPIDEVEGPAIEDIYGNDRTLKPTLRFAGQRLVVNIKSQLDYEWSKLP
jgi:hypothetical protein